MSSMSEAALQRAIGMLGGQTRAAALPKRKQSTLSGYLRGSTAPAEICIRIEVATEGQVTAESIRPDLADEFSAVKEINRDSGVDPSPRSAGRKQGVHPRLPRGPLAGRDGPAPTRRAASFAAACNDEEVR